MTTTTLFGITGTGLTFGQRVNYAIEGLYIQPATFSSGTINPGTSGNNGSNTNNNGTNTNNNNNNNGGNNGGNNGTNTSGQNTSGQNTSGQNTSGQNTSGDTTQHGQTYQLTGLRYTNYITYIEPVFPTGNAVTGTGLNNVNVTVPATRGANDYILQVSTDAGFVNSRTYTAIAGAYSNTTPDNPTNQGVSPINAANSNAVIFNNINLTTDFPNGTVFFYRIGARDSTNNGQSGFSNPYIYNDPLPLTISGVASGNLLSRLRPSVIRRSRN